MLLTCPILTSPDFVFFFQAGDETANEDELLLDKLTMKRTWESDNHPYLFFNEDGATITPLGFFVKTESRKLLPSFSCKMML